MQEAPQACGVVNISPAPHSLRLAGAPVTPPLDQCGEWRQSLLQTPVGAVIIQRVAQMVGRETMPGPMYERIMGPLCVSMQQLVG